MQTSQRLFLALIAIAGTLAAQTPAFTGIVNAASSIPPGFPNYAIAQGSIFLIYGSNLSNAPVSGAFTAAPLPLPTTAGLTGTVITVTVGSTTVTAPILFTLATQIGAVLPSSTPVGNGTLTLTYNGKPASTPIVVLASAFGISNSASGQGNSVAALTFGANQAEFVTQTDAAAPGDLVIMYGTGLGPVPASATDTLPYTGATNVGASPSIYVGGVLVPAASVAYYGRSGCCAGLDQIIFTIPATAPLGCQVSIIVQTSNGTVPIVSNGPTTAIAATHHTACTDPVDPVPPSFLSSQTNSKVLGLSLKQQIQVNSTPTGTTSSTSVRAQAFVLQFTPAQLAQLAFTNVESSEGSCFTGITLSGGSGGAPVATYLNAGSSVTLTPPSGNGAPLALPSVSTGIYQNTTLTSVPSGTWGFANSGGPDVAALTFNFPVPQPVVWTNQTALLNSTVTRANGLTITWSGGDQNGYVDIQGYAQNTGGTYQVGFDCAAPVSAAQFTIPASVLLAFPTGGSAMASLQVSTNALPFTLPAITGFTTGIDFTNLQTNIPLSFK